MGDYQAYVEQSAAHVLSNHELLMSTPSASRLTSFYPTPSESQNTIAQAVIDARHELDDAIKPYLMNWRFDRISVCAKLVLRLAFWELLNTDVAPTIVINEAIELAKCFAEADAYRFINGVLDSFVKKREASTT